MGNKYQYKGQIFLFSSFSKGIHPIVNGDLEGLYVALFNTLLKKFTFLPEIRYCVGANRRESRGSRGSPVLNRLKSTHCTHLS